METYKLKVLKLYPWENFNEYEGELEGILNDVAVRAYVIMNGDDWSRYPPGLELQVNAWLQRYGIIEALPPDSTPMLRAIQGSFYDVTGLVTSRDGEQLSMDTILSLRVDLDFPLTGFLGFLPSPGDFIRVCGQLHVDFDLTGSE